MAENALTNRQTNSSWLDFFVWLVWATVQTFPVMLVWIGLWLTFWQPWEELGTTPLSALSNLIWLSAIVWVPLLLITIACRIFGWTTLTRWAWTGFCWTTPVGDFVRLGRKVGHGSSIMRMPMKELGLIDSHTGKPLHTVRTTVDNKQGVWTVMWPTGIYGTDAPQLKAKAENVSGHFDAARWDVQRTSNGKWKITWYRNPLPDGLAGVRDSQVGAGQRPLGPVVMGRRADGGDAVLDLRDASHVALQGQTRSGKSMAVYTLLGQLCDMPPDQIEVWVIDPNGVSGRPWDKVFGSEVVLGSNPEKAGEWFEVATAELDRRIELLSQHRLEALTEEHFGSVAPLLILGLEEFPSVIRAAKIYDAGQKPADRVGTRIQAAYGRLVAEGAKAGIRVILIAQRADAETVGGGERGQFGTRVTLGVDNGDAVRMLSPTATPEQVAAAVLYTRGRCLWQTRGELPVEVQLDKTEYSTYLTAVEGDLAA